MAERVALNDRVLRTVEEARDELVELAAGLVRFPTVNPPGEGYRDCAEWLGGRLEGFDFDVDYVTADERPEHSERYPRVNVIGVRRGQRENPCVHLNGHLDVVPVGEGWTVDPFAAVVRDGRLYGRGSADMKCGLACAIFAAEALRRAGAELAGSIEISGTVDEESGGFAGVAHLCEIGRIAAGRTDQVIIPEPLNPDRICVGHRGVYWFELTVRGRIAHGSMPFLGSSAIDGMGAFLEALRTRLRPSLAGRRTAMPVVPEAARQASINVNSVFGGQVGESEQTPCVADRCTAIVDRRFLVEEGFETARREIEELIEETAARAGDSALGFDLRDRMVVHPVLTPAHSPLVGSLDRSVEAVFGRRAERVASPGTYDHKHVARIAGVEECVAYGPGILEQAHQPDEWCGIDDMVKATQVMALTLLDLTC